MLLVIPSISPLKTVARLRCFTMRILELHHLEDISLSNTLLHITYRNKS